MGRTQIRASARHRAAIPGRRALLTRVPSAGPPSTRSTDVYCRHQWSRSFLRCLAVCFHVATSHFLMIHPKFRAIVSISDSSDCRLPQDPAPPNRIRGLVPAQSANRLLEASSAMADALARLEQIH